MVRERVIARLLTAATIAALCACSATRVETTTLYEELGGEPGVERIVHELLLEIAADDVLKPHFRNIHIAGFRSRLESFFCQIADGPCDYNGRSMRASHATLGIDRRAFNRLVAGLIRAMDEVGVAYGSQNALLSRLAVMESDIVTGRPFERSLAAGTATR
ncbi:MAG: group 1 truncated hemoglobin [Pseudomonadota bacterium]